METCFMSEKNYLLKCYLKKELNFVTASEKLRDEASKQHYFDTFEHPCRSIPLINVEKLILFFFLTKLLFIVLSAA